MVCLRPPVVAMLTWTMPATVVESQMSMLALGDWGGGDTAPFFSAVERANANAMAGVMADPDTTTPSFGLLMGDNFYTRGISCINKDKDPDCTADVHSHRFADTFENVFDQPQFVDFPFYVILGNHDHYGNATAQLEYGTKRMGTGRWRFPALGVDQLYYKLERPFTDAEGNEVTVDLFMIDTVQWAGLREQCYPFRNATDETIELLFDSQAGRMPSAGGPINITFAEAKAECAGSPRGSCCLVDSYYNHLPPPPPPPSHDGGPCDEESWPDVDGGKICGECYVLIDHFSSKYHGSCDEYCRSVNRSCTGAWEEQNDNCARYNPDESPTQVTCSGSTGRVTSDALCECLGDFVAPEPEPAPPWPAAGDPGPCDEASWPDKDHDLVCGECTVLVNHFSSYETCDGYCASIGRGCVGGWEEANDDCGVLYAADCGTAIPGSDALCQCSESADVVTAECAAHGLDEAEWTVSCHDIAAIWVAFFSRCQHVVLSTGAGGPRRHGAVAVGRAAARRRPSADARNYLRRDYCERPVPG